MSSILKVDNIQHTNGTNAMTIDSSGIVSKPATPSWILLGIPNNIGSQAVVGWGQQSYNPGTQSQTNGGVTFSGSETIQVPKAGLYQINFVFKWRAAASSEIYMLLQGSTDNFSTSYAHGADSNNGYIIIQEYHDHGTEWMTNSWTGLINCTANEYLRVKQSSSVAITVPNNAANGGMWSGYYIG